MRWVGSKLVPILGLLIVCLTIAAVESKKAKEKPDWAKKSVHDMNDNDLERLYEQWEEDEEDLPLDELPDWDPRKPQPMVDFSKLDMSNPDNIMKATKKGKTIMLFAKVAGNPERQKTEQLTSIWQTGLWNSHIQADRFLLEDDRVIFMFQDGEHAWEARDFLIEQEECYDVQLESKTYCGIHFPECQVEVDKKEAKEKKDADKRKKQREKKKKKEEEKKRKEEEEKLLKEQEEEKKKRAAEDEEWELIKEEEEEVKKEEVTKKKSKKKKEEL